MDSVIHSGVKLRHLRFFLQIADSGTLSAAARVLGISQPALSKSLAEFEAMMGAPMFLRLGRKMTPTPEGEKVLCWVVTVRMQRVCRMCHTKCIC